MENNILDYLFKNCFSKADLLHHLSTLESFFEFYFFQNQTLSLVTSQKEYFLKENIQESDKEILLSYPVSFYSFFSLENFYDLLKKAREFIEKMENLTISLPFEAASREKEKIGKKVYDLFSGRRIAFDFKHDPLLLAGCALIFRGIYKDYSLKNILENNEQEVRNIIASYA